MGKRREGGREGGREGREVGAPPPPPHTRPHALAHPLPYLLGRSRMRLSVFTPLAAASWITILPTALVAPF